MVRTLKRPETASIDPYKAQPLPLGKPVSVYCRQSSEGQIGNISTMLQTVDMVEHLMAQGWQREQINMIDMDAGISGQKKISERPGMSLLYRQIKNGEIGLVAAQDVDRFFRDLTQIETNIFIDACKRNNVQVLTPSFVYDFAHPVRGKGSERVLECSFVKEKLKKHNQPNSDKLCYLQIGALCAPTRKRTTNL